MSSSLSKLLYLIKHAISKGKNTKDLKRLIKWAIGVCLLIIWYFKYRTRYHDNIITLDEWSPITGHTLLVFKYWDNLNQHIYEMVKRKKFPKCAAMTSFTRSYGIMLLDPELVKFVFHTKFESFKKGERVFEALEEMLGDGIFTSDPPKWRFHRKVASKMFSMRNLKSYMFQCTVDHTKQVINKINSDPNILNDVDIYNILGRFTLDTFTEIAFGKSVDSLSLYPKKHPFAEAFDNLIEAFAFRYSVPRFIWKPMKMLPFEIGNEGAIKRDMKVINAFSDKVLSSRQDRIKNISDEDNNKYNDIISLFYKHDNTLTQEQLKYIAMNMIIAGRDTTRLILSWCLYELCKRPQIMEKVYQEIDAFTKQNETLHYDNIGKSLLYTECTLLETLRLNPVVPWLVRHCLEDTKLPNGNIIRKYDEVSIPTYIYGRNPKIWEDPLRFDPNRFYNEVIKDNKDPVNVFDVYKYPFFNINPRLCLGRKLALIEAKVFLFYFCREYYFKMTDSNQNIKIKPGLVLNMVEGLRLKLTKR